MKIEYYPDPYIETIFSRLLDKVPPGEFYQLYNLNVPYKIDPTFFKITVNPENIGKRYSFKSDVENVKTIFRPDKEENIIGLILEPGFQTLTLELLNDNNIAIESIIFQIKVLNLGTITYSIALNIAKQWAEILSLHLYATSNFQLLLFESSLNDKVRSLLPSDVTLRLIALKNLVKLKNSNSTTESILSLASALSDVNPAKLTRHVNSTEFTNERSVENVAENSTQDLHLWFSSKAMGRRAVIARLAHNFPERFTSLQALDNGLIRQKQE